MIWQDGVLPTGAPQFSPLLTYDLQSYGYALLGLALRLRELDGDEAAARVAFEQAAVALEAVISRGNSRDVEHHFHHVLAAAAYHLARFSARSYSLLAKMQDREDNFSPIETALTQLMLRDLDELEHVILTRRMAGEESDASIAAYFEREWQRRSDDDLLADDDGGSFLLDGVDRALNDNFFAGLTVFLLALEHGDEVLVARSIEILRSGLESCAELNLLPQWSTHRVTIHLINDLWAASFHRNLPFAPTQGGADQWLDMRQRYLAVLLRRAKAEIDLWPSQIDAASRAVNQTDDLVVSLPTSAGKTRIAELCILNCLAAGKRVIFVTPLRALSAQTEIGLQRTFAPLGKTVSALYGSIGASGLDQDALRRRDIVVATPEKLDFALRNDPSLIDDVGLVVLDEGHMIGLGEREVRYEVQIQRLLKRADANQRRIVCLSAILPDGDQLEDFANWLRRDRPGDIVRHHWRPTRLRFGEIVWRRNAARLNLHVEGERPFVPRFITANVPPVGKRRKPFPKDLGELCLASAWRLVEDGQSVLIFCPVRAHVTPFADRIVNLHRRGALRTLLDVPETELHAALGLGEEWLGADHPVLTCLKLGVAIHHGALPTAYRKEVEKLLQRGILKVTISSPTLAQGLNLSATAVVMHSLFRNRERIKSSEFKNIVGRAGRAYVDVEGLVLYPIFDKHAKRERDWQRLIDELGSHELESGLVRLVVTLLQRMQRMLDRPPLDQFVDYLLNNTTAWTFPDLPNESAEQRKLEHAKWTTYLATLDTAVLGLLGEQDVADDDIATWLDEILTSSLWERSLNRRSDGLRTLLNAGLLSRAKHVWAKSTAQQRRGYFLAGIGLNSGHALDEIAPHANALLVQANGAILVGDSEAAIQAITTFAEVVFAIHPFIPDVLPENWHNVLRLWLSGAPLAGAAPGHEDEVLRFVEGGLVYRLPWAMEAVRVRGLANGDDIGDGLTFADVEMSLAVAAVETGTLNRPAALLMQAGFASRLAAIKAVRDTNARFASFTELRDWLVSGTVEAATEQADWPTPETADLWRAFRTSSAPKAEAVWKERRYEAPVAWLRTIDAPPAGVAVRLYCNPDHPEPTVLLETGRRAGQLEAPLNPNRTGLTLATVLEDRSGVLVTYIGPEDVWLQ